MEQVDMALRAALSLEALWWDVPVHYYFAAVIRDNAVTPGDVTSLLVSRSRRAMRDEELKKEIFTSIMSASLTPQVWSIQEKSSTWAESGDFARFVPVSSAGGPEPFHVTVGASRIGYTAEAAHRHA